MRQAGQGSRLVGSVDGLLTDATTRLDHAARWLSGTAHDYVPPAFGRGLEESVADLSRATGSAQDREDAGWLEQLIAPIAALAGQLRAIEGLLPLPRRPGRALEGVAVQLRVLRLRRRDPKAVLKRLTANLSWRSSAVRHAVRVAVVVVVATRSAS